MGYVIGFGGKLRTQAQSMGERNEAACRSTRGVVDKIS